MMLDTTRPPTKPMNSLNRVYHLNPWAIDTLKLIALFAMLLDHTNTVLGLKIEALRIIGRMAFPLFGLIWAHNWVMNEGKPRRQESTNRMWAWAIIAQPFYYYALAPHGWRLYDANILFCFAAASQSIVWLKNRNIFLAPLAALLLLTTVYLTEAGEYGVYGMVFLLACYIFYTLRGKKAVLLANVALMTFCAYQLNSGSATRATAGALLPLLAMGVTLLISGLGAKRYLPPKIFYYAYAGQFAALGLLATWLSQ